MNIDILIDLTKTSYFSFKKAIKIRKFINAAKSSQVVNLSHLPLHNFSVIMQTNFALKKVRYFKLQRIVPFNPCLTSSYTSSGKGYGTPYRIHTSTLLHYCKITFKCASYTYDVYYSHCNRLLILC